jgi:hypothetical protein
VLRSQIAELETKREGRPTSASRKRFVRGHVGDESVPRDRIATTPNPTMTAAPQALNHTLSVSATARLDLDENRITLHRNQRFAFFHGQERKDAENGHHRLPDLKQLLLLDFETRFEHDDGPDHPHAVRDGGEGSAVGIAVRHRFDHEDGDQGVGSEAW